MRDSSLRKLTVDEYMAEEEKFFKNLGKYFDKKCAINQEEHEFIETIGDENLSFSDKSDIYFNNYKDVVKKFERRRKYNEKKYNGYTSIYYTDFYTELNDEFINKRMKQGTVDLNTMKHLLQELNDRKGTYFKGGLHDEELFKFVFVGVQVDDFYYVGVNDKGEYCWHSAVGMPEFI